MAVVLEAGTLVADRYRLDRMLGQGGMGVVWAATHAITRRTVAMKFVRSSTLQQRSELRGRLLREAHAAAAVRHPNVVEILDVFELDSDTPVIVMTLLQGETLGQRLAREQSLSLADTASLLLPAISAIGTAHARGIVHRDLKPDNIYLSQGPEGSTVKVLDFGIAKLLDPEDLHDSVATQTGSTLGTPSYMAPEQATGAKDVDHRADVWALGVIAYECLSGMRPIEGQSAGQVIMRLMTTGITPLARVTRGLPEDVTALVDRMLARETTRRLHDLREAQRVLARYSDASAQDFGAPRSELSTAFERESRRTSIPVTFGADAATESTGENTSATLVNAALPLDETARKGAPLQRQRPKALKGMSALGASAFLALLVWRLVGASAQPDTVAAASTGANAMAGTKAAVGSPSTTLAAAAPTAALAQALPQPAQPSALPAKKVATPKKQPAATPSGAAPPTLAPAAPSIPGPAPSSNAGGSTATERPHGIVNEVPF
jgi:eukaryotic-like serine/threonine-protein kinase